MAKNLPCSDAEKRRRLILTLEIIKQEINMELIVLRKLIVGIVVLLLATGVIKWEAVNKHLWLRVTLYIAGVALIIFAALYQFDVIPESSRDAIFK